MSKEMKKEVTSSLAKLINVLDNDHVPSLDSKKEVNQALSLQIKDFEIRPTSENMFVYFPISKTGEYYCLKFLQDMRIISERDAKDLTTEDFTADWPEQRQKYLVPKRLKPEELALNHFEEIECGYKSRIFKNPTGSYSAKIKYPLSGDEVRLGIRVSIRPTKR